jgi:hypothetical protein
MEVGIGVLILVLIKCIGKQEQILGGAEDGTE